MIRDLVQGALKYGIEIPTDFMLVGKALMTIEGIGKSSTPTSTSSARRARTSSSS